MLRPKASLKDMQAHTSLEKVRIKDTSIIHVRVAMENESVLGTCLPNRRISRGFLVLQGSLARSQLLQCFRLMLLPRQLLLRR